MDNQSFNPNEIGCMGDAVAGSEIITSIAGLEKSTTTKGTKEKEEAEEELISAAT